MSIGEADKEDMIQLIHTHHTMICVGGKRLQSVENPHWVANVCF